MEALNAVSTYIKDIKSKYVVLMLGNLYANIDLTVPMKQHKRSGAEITAICADRCVDGSRLRYVTGDDGFCEAHAHKAARRKQRRRLARSVHH